MHKYQPHFFLKLKSQLVKKDKLIFQFYPVILKKRKCEFQRAVTHADVATDRVSSTWCHFWII